MNEENKVGYYAIIPATILFNEKLKANEKLLYAVITVLANREGYCFASNAYFGKLFNVQNHTVSGWVSHLKELGFIYLSIIKNEKEEIIQRRIYINDVPYTKKNTYPYGINNTEGIPQKGQYNNISINNINNDKIDRFFNYIIYNDEEIPEDFLNVNYEEIITALRRYEMLYPKEIIEKMEEENVKKIKDITYIIALIVKDKLFYLADRVSREKLIHIYHECLNKKENNEIESFINYYYQCIKNELLKE